MAFSAMVLTASAVESVAQSAAGSNAASTASAISDAASAVTSAVSSAASAVESAAADVVSKGSTLPGWFPILIAAIIVVAVCAAAFVIIKARKPVDLGPKTQEGLALLTCDGGTLQAPVAGSVISRERIPDETFSSGFVGEGFGIIPTAEVVTAPCGGVITNAEKAAHCVQMKTDSKMEVLVQVGIDTLDMGGDGFECFVKKGDRVEAGQPLIAFSREKIDKAGHSDCVVVLLTNASDFKNVQIGM